MLHLLIPEYLQGLERRGGQERWPCEINSDDRATRNDVNDVDIYTVDIGECWSKQVVHLPKTRT